MGMLFKIYATESYIRVNFLCFIDCSNYATFEVGKRLEPQAPAGQPISDGGLLKGLQISLINEIR